MLRIASCLLLSFLTCFFGAKARAQVFSPGKLVQVRVPNEYPFARSSTDSLIGRKYILMAPTWGVANYAIGEKTKSTSPSETKTLDAIFLKQPSPDSLLNPWIGKQFQILDSEPDTSFGGIFKELFLLAKFSKDFTAVLKVDASDLQRDNGRLLSAANLDSARARWRGKYLWMNINSNTQNFPAFSKVKVLDIEPEVSFRGPYAFSIVSSNGDTDTVQCSLQPPDTSRYATDFGNSFGKFFLDDVPSAFWKTVPSSNFDYAGIALGQDSTTFFQKMKSLGVRIQSYRVFYAISGEDSTFSIELRGKGIWGMPLDTCSAIFGFGKLNAISFEIFDSGTQHSIRADLFQRFGNPSVIDSSHGISKITMDIWAYYSSEGKLSDIILMDMNSVFDSLNKLPQISGKDKLSFRVSTGMVLYGNGDDNSARQGMLR